MKPAVEKHRFPQCESCVNREYDPFECITCRKGSNFEPFDTQDEAPESMSYDEFLTIYRDN